MGTVFFPRIAELACESPKKLAEQVVNLQFTVEEKERAVEVLRQAIDHQRKLSANFSQKFQKELNQRLAAQKTEYEATITRHQNFIDQVRKTGNTRKKFGKERILLSVFCWRRLQNIKSEFLDISI